MVALSGELGKLRAGFRFAAYIRDWSVTRQQPAIGPAEVTFSGSVTITDSFYCTHRPLTLGLWMDPTWWVWAIDIDGQIEPGKPVSIRLIGNPVAQSTF